MDGVALGAAVVAEFAHAHGGLAGFGVFLAVLLHKPLDALSVTGLMATGTWSKQSRTIVNLCFSLICPLGAFLFLKFAPDYGTQNYANVLGIGLGFSAGAFLCISLSDLLPEVQFHRHDRGKLSASLLLGVLLAYGIGYLEGEHAHSHGESQSTEHSEMHNHPPHSGHDHDHDHDHAGHNH